MNTHPTTMHLLKAIIFAGLAGAVSYGVTAWLAPEGILPTTVTTVVALMAAFGVLSPHDALQRAERSKVSNPWSPPDMHFDSQFSLSKDLPWREFGSSAHEDSSGDPDDQ